MRNQCSGYGTPIPPHRQYGNDPIYASSGKKPDNDNNVKGWCLNPACGQKLNCYNLKPPFLCHKCQKEWRKGKLTILFNSNNIVGYPAFGATRRFPSLKTLAGIRGNRLVAS
ncbi:MAG: hypothetical protein PHP25_05000 [Candidatus Moranbacteria bacterium]|nr:hypothetical protein [Candidatus Moranbacteria bacterium]